MKMEYLNPEFEVVKFSVEDVLDTSVENYTPIEAYESNTSEI